MDPFQNAFFTSSDIDSPADALVREAIQNSLDANERGDREGQYSIRVNDQWRICFVWESGGAYQVAIVDYHQESIMRKDKLSPIHPGELLLEEFLKPLGMSQYRLAKGIAVPPRRVNEIVHGKRSITADTALRLARFFGTTERFWLNLQVRYDLEVEKDRIGHLLERDVEVFAAAS